jgi:hypothetical protein
MNKLKKREELGEKLLAKELRLQTGKKVDTKTALSEKEAEKKTTDKKETTTKVSEKKEIKKEAKKDLPKDAPKQKIEAKAHQEISAADITGSKTFLSLKSTL